MYPFLFPTRNQRPKRTRTGSHHIYIPIAIKIKQKFDIAKWLFKI
jgi:hypothetical protein